MKNLKKSKQTTLPFIPVQDDTALTCVCFFKCSDQWFKPSHTTRVNMTRLFHFPIHLVYRTDF